MERKTIAVDAMGGDHGPRVTVAAALKVLELTEDVDLILVGLKDKLTQALKRFGGDESERLIIHHASEVVAMDESPSLAMRNKKDSSMRVALNLVKSGQAQACVSAGNTGALMATSRYVLKTVRGIDRPAIITALPSMKSHSYILDLGANVDCTAEHLLQFAVMGTVMAQSVWGIERPAVGLLNIGEEEIKGNQQVKDAARYLANMPSINYIGYVEGDDIYKGTADVIVCDGFVGNIALKTSEGLARLVFHHMREAFSKSWLTKLVALFAKPILQKVVKALDPRDYNGASLVGLRGIVIKSHGGADIQAYTNALLEAATEISNDVPNAVASRLDMLISAKEA